MYSRWALERVSEEAAISRADPMDKVRTMLTMTVLCCYYYYKVGEPGRMA